MIVVSNSIVFTVRRLGKDQALSHLDLYPIIIQIRSGGYVIGLLPPREGVIHGHKPELNLKNWGHRSYPETRKACNFLNNNRK